jgi:hypothetical protein
MGGGARIEAERRVHASPERVDRFLADLRNHWTLVPSLVSPCEKATREAASVELHGPLGIRRWAATRITERVPKTRIAGEAIIPPGSTAVVEWSLTELPSGSTVVHVAIAVEASRRDRLLLTLGVRRWIAKRARDALDGLAGRVAVGTGGDVRPPVRGSEKL